MVDGILIKTIMTIPRSVLVGEAGLTYCVCSSAPPCPWLHGTLNAPGEGHQRAIPVIHAATTQVPNVTASCLSPMLPNAACNRAAKRAVTMPSVCFGVCRVLCVSHRRFLGMRHVARLASRPSRPSWRDAHAGRRHRHGHPCTRDACRNLGRWSRSSRSHTGRLCRW